MCRPAPPASWWSASPSTNARPGSCLTGAAAARCAPGWRGSSVTSGSTRSMAHVETTWTVSARLEGELCDLRQYEKYGTCGDNLDCEHQHETGESICVCRETKEICGSDGLTYGSPCQLNEESVRREASPNLPVLSMAYWGPCKEAPAIISPPSDTYGPIGANLTLDCEARGYPAPTISWQYDNVEGKTILP